jgi:transcriptional regulator with XRE-family HTH domain
MFAIAELSQAVRARRSDMGLTQTELARLSGLSRATVNQVENGTLKDLSLTRTAKLLTTLGLSITISPARPKRLPSVRKPSMPALTQASQSASVSYSQSLPPEILEEALASCVVPPDYAPHLNAFLEDTSTALLANVVEEVHAKRGIERQVLWSALKGLAKLLGSRRDVLVEHP